MNWQFATGNLQCSCSGLAHTSGPTRPLPQKGFFAGDGCGVRDAWWLPFRGRGARGQIAGAVEQYAKRDCDDAPVAQINLFIHRNISNLHCSRVDITCSTSKISCNSSIINCK